MAQRESFAIGTVRLALTTASIAKLRADAIVSPDDSALSHDGGASAAIWEAAGDALASWADEPREPPGLGEIVVSPAGRLRARHVFHAITIDFEANRRATAGDVTRLAADVVRRADELRLASLALPRLASGAAGLPAEAVDDALAGGLVEALAEAKHVRTVLVSVEPAAFDGAAAAFRNAVPDREGLLEDAAAFAASLAARGIDTERLAFALDPARELPWPLQVTELFDRFLELLVESKWPQQPRDVHRRARPRSSPDAVATLEETPPLPKKGGKVRASPWASYVATLAERVSDVAPALATALPGALAARSAILSPSAASFGRLAHARRLASTLRAVFDHDRANHRVAAAREGAREPPRSCVTRSTTLATSPSAAVKTVTAGIEHVRRLHQLLLDHLDDASRAQLLESLQGFRGDDDMKLLEHCVTQSPWAVLVDHFNVGQRSQIYRGVFGVKPAAGLSSNDIVQKLLLHCGFPVRVTPEGLVSVRRELEEAASHARTASDPECAAAVLKSAGRLEFLLRVLLRFVARAAFGQSAEALATLVDKKRGQRPSLRRTSLGGLVQILEPLDGELAKSTLPSAVRFRASIGKCPLLPRGQGGRLAHLRNEFAHPGSDEVRGPRRPRLLATEFFDLASQFLASLADEKTRVFPHVISVVRIEIDEFGRRLTHAIDDGGLSHKIFSAAELVPGLVYYMRPLTNPIRVDPILVEGGDGEPETEAGANA